MAALVLEKRNDWGARKRPVLPQFKLGVAFRPEILARRFSALRVRA